LVAINLGSVAVNSGLSHRIVAVMWVQFCDDCGFDDL
jgi:hypothetical protein